ncbi:MAG: DUF3786 domain-containing protein [Pseudomonadota bacterium]
MDKTHFSDLEICDPRDVVLRTGCDYNPARRQYTVKIWGHQYCVDLEQCRVICDGHDVKTYQGFLYLFIVFYLMNARKLKPSGQWVSEKDIMGGAAFFRGPHILPVDVIADRIKNDISAFKRMCQNLGGKPIEFADAAFSFDITPLIPVAVLYWQGDQDFPCEVKLLFDQTIEAHLPLDIIFALAVEVCHAFVRA